MVTLPETNIFAENWWLEDEISLCKGPFSGAKVLVSGRVVIVTIVKCGLKGSIVNRGLVE